MAVFDLNLAEVRDIVNELAADGMTRSFYASYVSDYLHISMDETVQYLDKLVEDGWLVMKFEIRVSQTLDIIKIVDDFTKYIGEQIEYEGNEYTIDLGNIYPVYYFGVDYQKYVLNLKIKDRHSP